jgi:hypothetical protein
MAAGVYTPKSTPVKGETTVDDKSGSLVEVVALRGLDTVADTIVEAVGAEGVGATAVLIVEDRALAQSEAPRAEITGRLALFAERFAAAQLSLDVPADAPQAQQALLTPQVAPVLAAAPAVGQAALGVVGLAADLIGMFKTDYSIKGRDVNVDYAALAAAVAGKLTAGEKTVVIDGMQSLENSPTIAALNDLLEARAKLEELADRRTAVELDPTTAQIDALNARITAASAASDKAREAGKADDAQRADALLADLRTQLETTASDDYRLLKAKIAAATALIASFDQYVTAISAVPDGQTYPPIVAAALRDVLHQEGGPSHVLFLAVLSAAGEMITQTGLFSSNRHVGLIGAVAASYILVDEEGVVRASGSTGAYSNARFDVSQAKLSWPGGSS